MHARQVTREPCNGPFVPIQGNVGFSIESDAFPKMGGIAQCTRNIRILLLDSDNFLCKLCVIQRSGFRMQTFVSVTLGRSLHLFDCS
ncbi:hypothetical protein ADM96_08325 [Burkholderia sp. ST111]|nr:hypothetical protein ADM96_08325 [Burkholderia sp. ST111]